MQFKINRLLTVFLFVISLLTACSKPDVSAPPSPAPTPTPTPTPTPQATTLPNTGAGDVVGIFAGASAAGTAAHAVITRRRR